LNFGADIISTPVLCVNIALNRSGIAEGAFTLRLTASMKKSVRRPFDVRFST
jgi:hypothetical protein